MFAFSIFYALEYLMYHYLMEMIMLKVRKKQNKTNHLWFQNVTVCLAQLSVSWTKDRFRIFQTRSVHLVCLGDELIDLVTYSYSKQPELLIKQLT